MTSKPIKKLQILVIDDEEDLRDLIGFALENELNASILYAFSGNSAISLLKEKIDQIDLIVCDYRMPDGNGGDLFKYMYDHKITIPFILCSSDQPSQHPEFQLMPLAGYAEKPMFREPLIAAVKKWLTDNDKISPQTIIPIIPHFVKVHLRLLKLVNILPCEVFIRLGEEKYIKIYNYSEPFTAEDLMKCINKKIDYLYIEYKNSEMFFNKLINEHISSTAFNLAKDSIPESDLDIHKDLAESMHDIGSKLGFTKELEQITITNVNLTLQLVSKNPSLAHLLKKINLKDPNYISTHSILLSCVCCWIASQIQWQSDQTYSKLILAAFLHDITLNPQDLARIQNLDELENNLYDFSSEEKKQWIEHPIKASKIASQFKEIPPDVDTIIVQHHEHPHGTGFPQRLNHSRIAPMAALFIIADDLIHFLSEQPVNDCNLDSFVKQRASTYNSGQFKKILQAITPSPSPSP